MTDYIEKNSVIELIDDAIRNCKWHVAECTINKAVSSTELAVIAYQYGWTRRQTEVAAQVLRMNDVWKEIGA